MKVVSKIAGLLLTATSLLTPLAADVPAGSDRSHSSPGQAACHMHGGSGLSHSLALSHAHLSPPQSSIPRRSIPAPRTYECCLTGHNAAVVQASLSSQPAEQCTAFVPSSESSINGSQSLQRLKIVAPDPDARPPLRI